MNNNVKFALVLALSVIVSISTSYVTTLSLNQTNQQTPSNLDSPQPSSSPTPQLTNSPSPQPTTTKITATYEVNLHPQDNESFIAVYSNEIIHNLTITYQYVALNGTDYITKVSYGTYTPVFNPNHVVEPNEVPFQFYRIPQYIISACSSTKLTYDTRGYADGITWDIRPQLNVTEVYGYS